MLILLYYLIYLKLMGYQTLFRIDFSSSEQEIRKYIDKLFYDPNGDFFWNDDEYVGWDNYERDILRISKKFPNVLITVRGQGECYDLISDNVDIDVWVQYFRGGKTTPAKQAEINVSFAEINVSFAEFDSRELE